MQLYVFTFTAVSLVVASEQDRQHGKGGQPKEQIDEHFFSDRNQSIRHKLAQSQCNQ